MDSIKEIISDFKKEDYYDRVNLHIHSNCSDGVLTPQEIIGQACEKNIEYISITDHNTINAYSNIDFNNLGNLNLIPGVEFDCWHGSVFLHILGYGIDLNDKNLRNLCAKNKKETELDIIRIFSARKAIKVIETIKNAGGIAIIAHPACCWAINIEKLVDELVNSGLDGIELYYPYIRHRGIIKFHSVNKIKKISEKKKLLVTGGTDCHKRDLTDSQPSFK